MLTGQKTQGVARKCVAFRMTDKSAPPRPGYPIRAANSPDPVGAVVSGTQSPSLGVGIGLAYTPPQFATPGTDLLVEIPENRRGPKWCANLSTAIRFDQRPLDA